MVLLSHVLPLCIAFHASAKVLSLQSSANDAALLSRKVLGPFTFNSTGSIEGRIGIEHRGLGKIILNGNRPIDSFIFNGNVLLAVGRNGSCYVNPETSHFHCEDVPENIPHSATKFGLAANGTLLFEDSANWWACPAQNPNTFDVYFRTQKPSPYCKFTQLKCDGSEKHKRPTKEVPASRPTPPFPFRLGFEPDIPQENHEHHSQLGPFFLSGKSLMRGKNFDEYCFIESASRRLLCKGKTSPALMENWHTIDFSLSKNNTLQHGLSDAWLICTNSRGGFVGPFDSEKKEADPSCVSKLELVQMKAQLPKFTENLRIYFSIPKDSEPLYKIFSSRGKLRRKREATPTSPHLTCPTNLVDTLFKSPTLVIPISSANKSQAFGSVRNITLTPTQNTTFNVFIPFTRPYYDKICSLLLLIPDVQHLRVKTQTAPPALQFSILETQVNENTTWETVPAGRVIATKRMPQEVKTGQDNSIVTFPCEAGQTMSFMMASKGGLSITINQEGVPNETGLHIVPCA